MAKETLSADSSLPLHEVLEAEYVALHGELPSGYPSSGESKTRLKGLWGAIHGLKEKRAALCISGGGIRSATFGLGILQGLARCGLLEKFHYLSTVSGGGYIGSWLSAWIKNDPDGIRGVVDELKNRPDSTLNPEPQPIRHLREFSNYLAPRTGLTSVDFWTLIATFIRNMFLNWLVLISWLAAAMMIPRLYLAAVNLQPNWPAWGPDMDLTKYAQLADQVRHDWDIWLCILVALGFVLIAMAMAYAIIDVPATGNARLSQRRFLEFRQLPLILASLVLAEWWALLRNVHGNEPFEPKAWLFKFVTFAIASYLTGGVFATVVLAFRRQKRERRIFNSLWRLGIIALAAALAGVSLWAIATRMFLEPPIRFTLSRDCEATPIPWSKQKIIIPKDTQGVITQIDRSYTIETEGRKGRIIESDFGFLELKPDEKPPIQYTLKHEGEAIPIPWSRQKMKLATGTQVLVTQIQKIYIIETHQGRARLTDKDVDALQLKPNENLPNRFPLPAPAKNAVKYVCFAPALILAVLLLVNFLFTGLTSWVTEDEDREWWGRSAAWILISIFGWIVVNVVVLWGAQVISATPNRLGVFLGDVKATPEAKGLLGAFGGVTGLVSALLAVRSKLSSRFGEKTGFQWLLVVVAVVFFVLLSIVISWILVLTGSQPWAQHATAWLLGGRQDQLADPNSWRVQLFVVAFLTGVMLLFGIVIGFFINANKFSLHATYRNRLIRAYLAASRTMRSPNLFTGFDPEDNIKLGDLAAEKPLHVLNGALNIVRGQQLAWQQRKAESFTMSRLHCGSYKVGYRPSAKYGEAITLGTAMAISGAAANPNMGYHSSPVLGLLMTLFNVRLGWWLGNPGSPGAKTWRRKGPQYSVGPLFSEAIGNTTDLYKYVNLSDGGHFENLGLYEMVLRRCHFIVVSDGGEDPDCAYADLGEAVRKIRIDFGIPIEFGTMSIYPRSAIDTLKTPGHNCAVGRIRYSVVDGDDAPDGIIVYIKPACYGDEPRDIYEYFKTNPTFPHESTGDQFFSESQFESYRMLGAYTMEKFCTDCDGDLRCFVRDILKRHLQMEAPDWLAALLEETKKQDRVSA
ncbi:MAG TPA: patatin-like phospholipase family protein [Candidatus Binatia bacterium]|nr:patatin-like phospholipase family protein [Candidatus Binatia bacterium]